MAMLQAPPPPGEQTKPKQANEPVTESADSAAAVVGTRASGRCRSGNRVQQLHKEGSESLRKSRRRRVAHGHCTIITE